MNLIHQSLLRTKLKERDLETREPSPKGPYLPFSPVLVVTFEILDI
ncbi:MAG: hypothetical protein Ct9H300mP18_13910 [Candidatus Neomarinimicrobiota bacterium]|nr:MAG: hypothetical protein Ct9H300mP18_13910 [Candidatus Neomarinimicrobiota bacterium]